jgi:hypothetical protein
VESIGEGKVYLRAIDWETFGVTGSNCTFTLELDKHTGEPSGEELWVSYEGPGSLTGRRSIILP